MFAALLFALALDDATLARPDVRACFDRVLKEGGYGRLPIESAAFVVRDGDRYQCRMWPRSVSYRAQSWDGALPANAVAIVHSHPRDLPEPSAQDRALAKRLGIPNFVVTPRAVTRAE